MQRYRSFQIVTEKRRDTHKTKNAAVPNWCCRILIAELLYNSQVSTTNALRIVRRAFASLIVSHDEPPTDSSFSSFCPLKRGGRARYASNFPKHKHGLSIIRRFAAAVGMSSRRLSVSLFRDVLMLCADDNRCNDQRDHADDTNVHRSENRLVRVFRFSRC